jgi:formylglycine-generating enzyme required for sulfatase activity
MRFVPIGKDLMVSIWETRLQDYQTFVRESGHKRAPVADFPQSATDPVVNVSRDDGVAFCEWLTKRERRDERIAQTHAYRLPTDLEWSTFAGLPEDEGISPINREARKPRIYPWGQAWLQGNQVVGNFADVSASLSAGLNISSTIPGYDDGFAHTAPVGSFEPNFYGLYDLSGNVQEWVSDKYSIIKYDYEALGVLRGGGWNTYKPEHLLTGSRNAVLPTYQDPTYGFRVVLARIPQKAE